MSKVVLRPEETVRRFKEKLKEVDLDILEETVRIDNGRLDIPVYFSLCGQDALRIIGTKKQMGKGGSPHQAEASAVMELVERFSFFSFYKNQEKCIETRKSSSPLTGSLPSMSSTGLAPETVWKKPSPRAFVRS